MALAIQENSKTSISRACDLEEFAATHGLLEVLENYCVEKFRTDVRSLKLSELDELQVTLTAMAAFLSVRSVARRMN